jgi:hypothetical protein
VDGSVNWDALWETSKGDLEHLALEVLSAHHTNTNDLEFGSAETVDSSLKEGMREVAVKSSA